MTTAAAAEQRTGISNYLCHRRPAVALALDLAWQELVGPEADRFADVAWTSIPIDSEEHGWPTVMVIMVGILARSGRRIRSVVQIPPELIPEAAPQVAERHAVAIFRGVVGEFMAQARADVS